MADKVLFLYEFDPPMQSTINYCYSEVTAYTAQGYF